MKIRSATIDDLPAIRRLAPHREGDLRPDSTTLQTAVILDNDSFLAYGAIRLLAEVAMVVNKSAPKVSQGRALKVLMSTALRICSRQGIPEVVAFTDPVFAHTLKRHFEFEDVKEITLIRTL